MVGTVSNIIPVKQYGFITGEDGLEYFFHKEETIANWQELVADFNTQGAGKIHLTFITYKTPKGPRAKSVAYKEE